MMEPEDDIEVITNFTMRNKLLDTLEEVNQLERLLKEAKDRLKMEMERRALSFQVPTKVILRSHNGHGREYQNRNS